MMDSFPGNRRKVIYHPHGIVEDGDGRFWITVAMVLRADDGQSARFDPVHLAWREVSGPDHADPSEWKNPQ